MAALASAGLLLGPSAAYKEDPTHHRLAEHSIDLATSGGLYRELAFYRQEIERAVVAEDRPARFVHHFWDPSTDQGLPRNSTTRLLVSVMRTEYELGVKAFGDGGPVAGGFAEPRSRGSRYVSALDWARNAMPDSLGWEGGIAAYDYTSSGRARAYESLGHVLHLLQDMGQPDHARNRPHPGNMYVFTTPMLRDRVGYEKLWELHGEWPRGEQVRVPSSLEDAFRSVAEAAQEAESSRGLPGTLELALGLTLAPSGVVAASFAVFDPMTAFRSFRDNLWTSYETNVPLVPTIHYPLFQDERTRAHLELGEEMLKLVEENGAGLLQLFHDIVNPPPYVEEVRLEQGGGDARYASRWENRASADGRVQSRERVTSGPGSLESGVETRLSVRFGPAYPIAGRDASMHRKSVQEVRVSIEQDDGAVIAVPVRFEPDPRSPRSDGAWVGRFVAQSGGRLRIEARDTENHFDARQQKGDRLDAHPGTPARAQPREPYEWSGYEPGPDTSHRFGVGDAECGLADPADLRRLRWAQISGSVSYEYEYRNERPHRYNKVNARQVTATAELRSNAALDIGRSDGLTEYRFEFGGNTTGQIREVDAGIRFDEPYGPVTATCDQPVLSGQLGPIGPGQPEADYEIHFQCGRDFVVTNGEDPTRSSTATSFGGIEGRACGLTLSGTREMPLDETELVDRLEWRFTIQPAEPPPFAATCDGLASEADAIERGGDNLVRQLQEPRVMMASSEARYLEAWGKAMEQLIATIYWHQQAPDLAGACIVLKDAWLTDQPSGGVTYPEALAEFERVQRDWHAAKRSAEGEAATALEQIAAAADAARKPAVGDLVREWSQRLRAEGLASFSR